MKNRKFVGYCPRKMRLLLLLVGLFVGGLANPAYADNSDKWMTKLNVLLGNRKLSHVRIPGSHDAGAYGEIQPGSVSTIGEGVSSFATNQDIPFLKQLEAGARYFDIRLLERFRGEYHFRHSDWVFKYTLAEALDEIATFLSDSGRSKEIIILDLHTQTEFFGGKSGYNVQSLVNFIAGPLGDSLITPEEVTDCGIPVVGNCTLTQLASKGNVLVFLHKNHWKLSETAKKMTFSWHRDFAADTYTEKSISQKAHWDELDSAANIGLPPTGQLWVMFGQMTPFPSTPLHLARPINPILGAKMYNSWLTKKLNIIAYDYIGKFTHDGKHVAKLIWESNVLQAP